jgi:HPt (histidine-containing phosphotransfer) domain-containing protein
MSDAGEGVVYVNAEEGKKRVMNNAKLYVKLLTKFRTDTKLDELIAFSGAQDWEKAQTSAHTIKGVAANLSLTELFKQCLDVETQIKGQALNPESMENLKACFSATLAEIDKVIVQNA